MPADQLFVMIVPLLSERISQTTGEPSAHMTLDVKCCLLALLLPHLRREVGLGVNNFVISSVDVNILLLHLGTELSHHNRRDSLVLVCLHNSLVSLRVIAGSLVCLRESVMICLAAFVVPETADVWFGLALFFDLHSNNFDLVVSEADLHFKHRGHNELVCLNGVEVVFLLLTVWILIVGLRDVNLAVCILLPIILLLFAFSLHL